MQNLIRYRWVWLAVVWSPSAWAATVTFGDDLSSIPLAAVTLCLFLSFIGGLASTLQKLAADVAPVRSIGLEIAKDLVVSLVAGLLAFFASEWMNFQAVFRPTRRHRGALAVLVDRCNLRDASGESDRAAVGRRRDRHKPRRAQLREHGLTPDPARTGTCRRAFARCTLSRFEWRSVGVRLLRDASRLTAPQVAHDGTQHAAPLRGRKLREQFANP